MNRFVLYTCLIAGLVITGLAGCAAPLQPLTISELEKAAETGGASAQYLIGYKYETGQDDLKDIERAVYWYTLSSNNDFPHAQHRLGKLHFQGLGVEQDFNAANNLFKSAAQQGYREAQLDYALFLYSLAPDEYLRPKEAYAWFRVLKINSPQEFRSIRDLAVALESEFDATELSEARVLADEYEKLYIPKVAVPQ